MLRSPHDLSAAAWTLDQACCPDSGSGRLNKFHAISGQLYLGDGTNVVIGYGNCNHDQAQKPNTYGYPGPNLDCT
jgi:hypothetical protein